MESCDVDGAFLASTRRLEGAIGRFVHTARVLALLGLLSPLAAATDVPGGSITGSTTWTLAGSPYVVKGNVTVQSGGSLTIQAGVDVRFTGNWSLTIGGTSVSSPGTLTANGTASTPITFQFNGTPGAGKWKYIRFQTGATASSSMSYCSVSHAGSSLGAVYCSTNSPSLANLTFVDSGTSAIYLTNASPSLAGSFSLTGSGTYLLSADATSLPNFSGVTLSSSNALLGTGSAQLWANFFASSPTLTGGSYRIEVMAGTVSASATWGGIANLTSIDMLGDLTIQGASSPVLTLAAGTTLRLPAGGDVFVGSANPSVHGDLVAAGTASAHVRIERAIAGSAWHYVNFRAGSTTSSSLSHCDLIGGGSTVASISCVSSTPALSDVTITDSATLGIQLASASPTFSGTIQLTGAGSYLISATDSTSEPTFSGATLSSSSTGPIAVGGARFWSHFFGGGSSLSGGPYRIQVLAGTQTESSTWGGVANLASIDMLGDLTIQGASSPVLTLAAGTTLRLPASGDIFVGSANPSVHGDLVAAGTASARVRIERAVTASAWHYVNFRAGSTTSSSLSHCDLVGGGSTVASIYCVSSTPALSDVTITDSATLGIQLAGASPSFSGTVQLTGTGSYLISATDTTSQPTFSGATLSSSSTGPIAVGGARFWSHFFGGGSSLSGGPYRIEVLAGTQTESSTWGGLANLSSIDFLGAFTVAHASSPILTIAPGTTLRFLASEFSVGTTSLPGALRALGTAGAPILFTTRSATPAAGQWFGISIDTDAAISQLEYCTVEYAGGGSNDADLRLANPRTIVRHCTLRNSSESGVVIAAGAPVLEFNTFSGNLYGIDALASALPGATIRNNLFTSNSTFGLRSVSTVGLVAQLNAWGDATGPSGIGPGSGNALSGNVLYEPWLESAPSSGFEWMNAAQSPDPFSPTGGATGFSARWNAAAQWTLEMRNSSSALVRSFTGTGDVVDQTWTGDDASGSPLPVGAYTYTLAATSVASGQPVPAARGAVTLDGTVPVARITSPDPFDFVTGTVSVQGSAGGTGFASYTLACKAGVSPTAGTWTTIATSTTAVTNGTLGSWNTLNLTQPIYTLRLTVQTSGGATAKHEVIARVLEITSLTALPTWFSPNGDSILDGTTLGASITWASNWTLTLAPQGGGAAVRTFTGSGEELALPWDGKDGSAILVSDGAYEAALHAVGLGSTVAVDTSMVVYVDVTPPTAVIAAPTPSQTILSMQPFQVEGTAADDNFDSYALSIGAGLTPPSFAVVLESNTEVTGGTGDNDLYLLPTSQYLPGDYTLRLEVADLAGNTSSTQRAFALDYIEITDVDNEPKVIDPSASETVEVEFTVSHDCDVSVDFHEWPSGALVATVSDTDLDAGVNTIVWDGLDGVGAYSTPDRLHYYVIRAEDALGRDGWFNDAADPLVGEVGASWGSTNVVTTGFDPWANDEIRVEYNVNGWLRSQITVRGTNLDRDLSPTGSFAPGAHVDFWDGRNQHGDIHIGSFHFYFGVPGNLPDPAVFLTRGPIRFDEFRAQAYLIHPVLGQVSGFEYELTRDASVTISIEDPNGSHVRTILPQTLQDAGTYDLDAGLGWDGRNDAGTVVAGEGTYSIVLSAVDLLTGKVYVRRGAVTVNR